MHSIIVATDFSEVANNAVHFACQMAADYGKQVVVFHSYVVPVTFNDNPMPVMPLDESKEIAETAMDTLMATLKQMYPAIAIDSHITYGEISDSLDEYSEQHQPWLIVIGNSAEDQDVLWFGSNVTSVMKDLPYRIMAVPASYTYRKPAKICLACDYKGISDTFPATDLTDMVTTAGAELHVLNVDHNNRSFGADTPVEAETLQELIGSAAPQYHYIDSENTNEGIQSFVSNNNIDWLVVIPHRYSFFEGLFHKSHTSAMVKMSHIPVIALHEKKA